jgi:hypothetical protein
MGIRIQFSCKPLCINKSPAIRPEWGHATHIRARHRPVGYFHVGPLHGIDAGLVAGTLGLK